MKQEEKSDAKKKFPSLYNLLHTDKAVDNYARALPHLDKINIREAKKSLIIELNYLRNPQATDSSQEGSSSNLTDEEDSENESSFNHYLCSLVIFTELKFVDLQEERALTGNSSSIWQSPALFGSLASFWMGTLLTSGKPCVPTSDSEVEKVTNNSYKNYFSYFITAISASYLLLLLLSSFSKRFIKKFLSKTFNDVKNDIEENKIENAELKMTAWILPYMLKFSFDEALKGEYHFLEGIIAEKSEQYETAKLAYINASSMCMGEVKVLALEKLINLYGKLQEKNSFSYVDEITQYIKDCPTNSEYYWSRFNYLKDKLNNSLMKLRNQEYSNFIEKFDHIICDTFSEYVFPNLAIIYYQLKAVRILCGNFSEKSDQLDIESRLALALNCFSHAQEHIKEHFPNLSEENEKNILSIQTLMKKISCKEVFEISKLAM